MPNPRTAFWDKDFDNEGRLIRPDVRYAAHQIWDKARQMAEFTLGDSAEAAEIFESCVARVSRYLDERNRELFTQRTCAFLLVAFRNALRSSAQKQRRVESIENLSPLHGQQADLTWQREIDLHLDVAKLVRQLSPRSRIILRLRHAGYRWVEVATLLGVTVPKAKSGFWREIAELRTNCAKKPPRRAGPTVKPGGNVSKQSKKLISSHPTRDLSSSEPDVALILSSRSPPGHLEFFSSY